MIFSLKSSLVLAALAVAHTTDACLQVSGRATAGLRATHKLELIDNGKKICESVNQSGAVNCDYKGYGMKWDKMLLHNEFKIEYRTPHGTFNIKSGKPNCEVNNGCCGGGK